MEVTELEGDRWQKLVFWRSLIFRVSLLLCIASFLLVLFFMFRYVNDKSQRIKKAQESARNQAQNATRKVSADLGQLMPLTKSIADDLSSGKLDDDQLVERLKDTIETHPELFGVNAAYKPYAYIGDTKKRLYAPYYARKDGKLQLIHAEGYGYDYTQPDRKDGSGFRTEWYHRPLAEGASWNEPYFGTASNTFLAEYAVPFYRTNALSQEKTTAGIITLSFSLDEVRHLVASLNLGNTGYGFILSEKGTVVSHPIKEYLGKNIASLGDGNLQAISQKITHGGTITHIDEATGQSFWIVRELIPSTKWTMGVVFNQKDVFDNTETFQQERGLIAMSIIAFLFFLSILLFRAHKGSAHNLWYVAISASFLCVVGIGFIWSLAITSPSDEDNQEVAVFDRVSVAAALNKFLASNLKLEREFHQEPPIHIPTGVFVQSIKFTGANNVVLTGYVWQKFSDGITDEVSPGIIFPEAEEIEIKEAYRSKEVIGWYFEGTLRQPFDYSKYPFDREDVWIRLWHKAFHRNIILTPDFTAYNLIKPDLKPGLEQNFVIEGWEIQKSFFSYKTNSYNTNFGIASYVGQKDFPELYFNIGLRRNFVNAFISDMIPIVVVAFLVFAVLMISTKHEQKIGLFGFSTSAVLAYCAALFFVLIVSHVHLRETLAAHGIIYLEYFYFVMYFAILAVSVNSLLFASNANLRFIHYRDNLLIKLLYWPVIWMLLLGITLVVFY